VACFSSLAPAQGGNNGFPDGVTIQLPTISVFNVNTVVSVPDGGTMSLGGVSRYAEGQISRGVPGLSNIPFVNRPFTNQAFGQMASANNASVNVQIIVMEEQEALVMQEAQRQAARRATTDPNGPVAIQQRADFLSRHMGRRR
jgi:type II secretory pathway component GspD/PulD (secretin)